MTVIAETFTPDGVLVERVVDQLDGTAVTEEWDGKTWRTVEIVDYRPASNLDQAAQLAALLAAKGHITEDEAAAVSGRSKAELAAEAEAWAVAAETSP